MNIEQHPEVAENQCSFCSRTKTEKYPFYTYSSSKDGFGLNLCPEHLSEMSKKVKQDNEKDFN